MRKFFTTLFIFTVALSIMSGSSPAQSEKIRVMVEVVGDGSWEVKDYVIRGLGSLQDVEIVEEYPDVYVHIIARRLVTSRGKRLGYVMSSTTSQVWDVFLDGGYPFHCSDYYGMWLEVGPDLRDLAVQCIISINSSVLDQIRAFRPVDTEV